MELQSSLIDDNEKSLQQFQVKLDESDLINQNLKSELIELNNKFTTNEDRYKADSELQNELIVLLQLKIENQNEMVF